MRVLFLAPQPFYQERGTPIAVKIALETLAKKLALTERAESVIDVLCYAEGEDVSIPGVSIHRTPSPQCLRGIRPGISLKKLLCDVIFLFSTLALVIKARKRQYTVIHAVEESVFIAWLVRQVWGIPYIYDMDSSLSLQVTEKWWWSKPLYPIMNFLEGIAVRGSVAVAPVCDALSAIAARHGSPHTVMLRDVSLLPLSSERDDCRDRTLGLNVRNEQPVILYVGNLEFYQGIDLLVEAFALVRNHPSQPHLVIVGGTPDSIEKYQAKAVHLGCDSTVSFLGPRPVSQLKDCLAAADIVVSPRVKGNNTPMKIYSYLHSGKALLATDLSTHRQVLDEEIAVLAPANAVGFADGIRILLDRPDVRKSIGENARQRAEALYTLSAFENQLTALYDEVRSRVSVVGPQTVVARKEA
jgi:glycosyltransferase involved in cell wall biosynthesis